jgi:hypothetical protein
VSSVATQITVCTVWLETAKRSPVRTTTAGDGNRSKHPTRMTWTSVQVPGRAPDEQRAS